MAPFFYSDRILDYSFGPDHPLKPERLRRTVRLLARYGVRSTDPGPGRDADPLLVHAPDYVEAVRVIGQAEAKVPSPRRDSRFGTHLESADRELRAQHGFESGDNPAFPNMHEVSLAYVRASAAAAESVAGGEPLAFAIGGGLHHAQRAFAAGFCVYNDPAIAVAILRKRFGKVAYVDLDVHHGDGVQAIFADDPSVLTISIHESPQTLWPRTGRMDERGENVANIPMVAGTTGDVWLDTFRRTALPALARFAPDALVLQLGTDTHVLDPLAHLRGNAADWLAAVVELQKLDLPVVVTGGGGYALSCVPRMWSSAVLTLLGIEYDDAFPPDLAQEWGTPTFSDPEPVATGRNVAEGEDVVREFTQTVLPRIYG